MHAISHTVRAQCREVTSRNTLRLREVQTCLNGILYRTRRYVENRNREKRIDTTLEMASGMRLESRLFTIGRLHIHLNTWAAIDPGFDQIWDTSLFGVRLVESETL